MLSLKLFAVVTSAALTSLSISACATPTAAPAPVPVINVKLSEFKIEMDRSSVPAGPVKFVVTNTGTITHEMLIEETTGVDEPLPLGGAEAEVSDLGPGKTATVEWKLDKPGTYRVACYMKDNGIDHIKSGMKTDLTITGK